MSSACILHIQKSEREKDNVVYQSSSSSAGSECGARNARYCSKNDLDPIRQMCVAHSVFIIIIFRTAYTKYFLQLVRLISTCAADK